jgi:hypothetical protein
VTIKYNLETKRFDVFPGEWWGGAVAVASFDERDQAMQFREAER